MSNFNVVVHGWPSRQKGCPGRDRVCGARMGVVRGTEVEPAVGGSHGYSGVSGIRGRDVVIVGGVGQAVPNNGLVISAVKVGGGPQGFGLGPGEAQTGRGW